MKNFNKQKSGVLLIAAVLLLVMAVGGTIAYLATSTDPVVNTFTPGSTDITVDEEFDGKVKTDVAIENNGTVDAYIRVKVLFTWQDASGNVYGTLPKVNEHYTIEWKLDGWDEGSDGFYYYTTPVAAEGTTGILFTNCQPVAESEPEGYDLHVEILAQSIQAQPTNVVVEKWGVTLGADGITISK